MPSQQLIAASTQTDLNAAWSAYLSRIYDDTPELSAVAARWVLSDNPKNIHVLSAGRDAHHIRTFLDDHPLRPVAFAAPIPFAWSKPVAGFETDELPAGIYAIGTKDAEHTSLVLDAVTQSSWIRPALRHGHLVLQQGKHTNQLAAHFDAAPCSILLIDATSLIYLRNDKARRFVGTKGSPISETVTGKLIFKDHRSNQQFKAILADFFGGESRRRRAMLEGTILLTLQRPEPTSSSSSTPLAVLTIRLASEPLEVDATELQNLLKLSPTQARIAKALVDGKTVQGYALDANLSENTVRWHLRILGTRLNCRTQADIVRFITRLFG